MNKKQRQPWLVASLAGLLLFTANAWAEQAGTVKTIQGKVQVERAGNRLPLQVGDPLQNMDRIIVPAQASAGFTLRDDTLISLGPNSSMLLRNVEFNPVTHEGSVDTSILKGSMRYVTGLIGRLNPKAIKIDTPDSTIGIRGTEFIVEVENDH
jgi:hypothetical protein